MIVQLLILGSAFNLTNTWDTSPPILFIIKVVLRLLELKGVSSPVLLTIPRVSPARTRLTPCLTLLLTWLRAKTTVLTFLTLKSQIPWSSVTDNYSSNSTCVYSSSHPNTSYTAFDSVVQCTHTSKTTTRRNTSNLPQTNPSTGPNSPISVASDPSPSSNHSCRPYPRNTFRHMTLATRSGSTARDGRRTLKQVYTNCLFLRTIGVLLTNLKVGGLSTLSILGVIPLSLRQLTSLLFLSIDPIFRPRNPKVGLTFRSL